MNAKRILRTYPALLAVGALLQATALAADYNPPDIVTLQPDLNATVSPYALDPIAVDPQIPTDEMVQLLRRKIKYVFIIFNENNSFDHEYGTFPGVDGLYSDGRKTRSAADTPGFTETYTDVSGETVTVRPFRIGPDENASFADTTDHSHAGLAKKLDVVSGQARMDGFAADEYNRFIRGAAGPAKEAALKQGTQYARLVMSYVDCATIPFFWQWANRFTIFDHIFATQNTPSSPNAIALLAGQSGETQWVKHGAKAVADQPISGVVNGKTYSGAATPAGVPVVADPQPFWGSPFDTTRASAMPTNSPRETLTPANTTENLTFANVLLTMGGADVGSRMARDNNAASDQKDIAADIPYIAARGSAPVNWRWYQNGFDAEANEPPALAGIPNINYVTHHNGAQYFGYIANNPAENVNMKGETDFFADVANNKLPDGGVIYVRGGYYNIKGFTPPIQNPRYPNPAGLTPDEINMINLAKSGDDDHPGYSDKQISEAMAGRVIAAVAENPTLWSQSAIIITYDETDGQYDHEPPRVLSYGPDGLPLSRGGRIPLILISPYARSGSVSHAEGDHNSVIETINAIFDLPALSSLPEEKAALEAGNAPAFNAFAQAHGPANFEQRYLGPRDTPSAITDNLLSGFSPKRLKGLAPPIPPDFAAIPASRLDSLPHDGGKGCATIGVTPTDANLPNAVPPGFNTLPTTLPAYN